MVIDSNCVTVGNRSDENMFESDDFDLDEEFLNDLDKKEDEYYSQQVDTDEAEICPKRPRLEQNSFDPSHREESKLFSKHESPERATSSTIPEEKPPASPSNSATASTFANYSSRRIKLLEDFKKCAAIDAAKNDKFPERKANKPMGIFRKFPGPAGLMRVAPTGAIEPIAGENLLHRQQSDHKALENCSQETRTLFSQSWLAMLDDLPLGFLDGHDISTVKHKARSNDSNSCQVPLLAGIVQHVKCGYENTTVVLKDLSDTIEATVDKDVLAEFPNAIERGAVFLLANAGLLTSKEVVPQYHLIFSSRNIVNVYSERKIFVSKSQMKKALSSLKQENIVDGARSGFWKKETSVVQSTADSYETQNNTVSSLSDGFDMYDDLILSCQDVENTTNVENHKAVSERRNEEMIDGKKQSESRLGVTRKSTLSPLESGDLDDITNSKIRRNSVETKKSNDQWLNEGFEDNDRTKILERELKTGSKLGDPDKNTLSLFESSDLDSLLSCIDVEENKWGSCKVEKNDDQTSSKRFHDCNKPGVEQKELKTLRKLDGSNINAKSPFESCDLEDLDNEFGLSWSKTDVATNSKNQKNIIPETTDSQIARKESNYILPILKNVENTSIESISMTNKRLEMLKQFVKCPVSKKIAAASKGLENEFLHLKMQPPKKTMSTTTCLKAISPRRDFRPEKPSKAEQPVEIDSRVEETSRSRKKDSEDIEELNVPRINEPARPVILAGNQVKPAPRESTRSRLAQFRSKDVLTPVSEYSETRTVSINSTEKAKNCLEENSTASDHIVVSDFATGLFSDSDNDSDDEIMSQLDLDGITATH